MNNRGFFNKIASNWDEICYHDPKKLRKIINLSKIKENSQILDVGTGTGVLIQYLLKTNPKSILAIDIAENMLNIARKKYKDERVSFIREDILNFNGKLFDYIFLYSVYPHFEDKEKLFKHIYSLLKNNGKIIIAHSESKEKINNIHKSKSEVKNHLLDSAETTSNVMKKYFIIKKIIDNKEMYFILGEKNI